MKKYMFTVIKARLTYDKFLVKAETEEKAARLVADGKIRESLTDIPAAHDYFYDTPTSIIIIDDTENDGCGYFKTIRRFDEDDFK